MHFVWFFMLELSKGDSGHKDQKRGQSTFKHDSDGSPAPSQKLIIL